MSGYTFTETSLNGTQYYTANLTMTVPAITSLNGTKIQCKTAGTTGGIAASNIAWLWIVGMILKFRNKEMFKHYYLQAHLYLLM